MATKLCSIDGCDKPNKAKMLCGTHYNQQLPNRHAKITLACDGCGKPVQKESRARRYETTQCADWLCRRWLTFGTGQSCEIPKDHWARMYGATSEWTPPKAPTLRFTTGQCADCGDWFTAIGTAGQSSYCSLRCSNRAARRRRRAREHNAPGEFRFSEVMRQYLKQGKVCAYCRQPCIGLPDPEHVLPLSRGGRNDMTNLVAACRACNSDKCDLTLSEWAEDRARRNMPIVHTVLPLTEDAYKHLVTHEPTAPAKRSLSLPRAA